MYESSLFGDHTSFLKDTLAHTANASTRNDFDGKNQNLLSGGTSIS